MSVTVHGRLVSSNGYTNIDLSYENIFLKSIVILGQSNIYSNILDIDYNILRPNISVQPAITQDTTFNILNTSNGDTGSIQITLTTGTENVHFNGVETFIIPTLPGSFTVNFTNNSGVLTFN